MSRDVDVLMAELASLRDALEALHNAVEALEPANQALVWLEAGKALQAISELRKHDGTQH